jgi:hypothetical protein
MITVKRLGYVLGYVWLRTGLRVAFDWHRHRDGASAGDAERICRA